MSIVCGTAMAQETSRITSVILYPGSATVERSARVVPGMTRLEISGLPANFDPQTVRVESDAGVRIGEVSTKDQSRTAASNARESAIEERIQALKDRQAVLEVDARSAQMTADFISRLGAPAGEKPAPLPSARSLAETIEVVRRGGSDAFGRIQKVQVQKREIDKQIRALERDLARLKSGANDVRTIAVGVSAERPGEVRVSYQVNGAGWRPAYRAGLDSGTSKVLLERLGAISQTTGEDWTNVRLKLSTGQPRLSPQGTEPRPWKLSLYSPHADRLSEISSGIVASRAPAALMRAKADELRQETPVELQTTFATEFEVPGAVSLPSDGRKLTVSLAKLSLPAKMRLRVVPRLDAAAVVTAEAERPEGVWLAGDIQLYRDGNYVGATSWNPQSSAALVLPFGRDSLVRVKVDRAKDRNGSGGIIAQRNQREVSDLYTLTSHHKTPVELLVLESSPVSTNDQIKVEAKFDPK
ncbi:MAG TPA: mucoidy inhibitor MuiA family protein, partial [Burkholderiales bacterium]|nr:mucoidy inhibitor MuiA family protein [Burkholderiales bacterium]